MRQQPAFRCATEEREGRLRGVRSARPLWARRELGSEIGFISAVVRDTPQQSVSRPHVGPTDARVHRQPGVIKKSNEICAKMARNPHNSARTQFHRAREPPRPPGLAGYCSRHPRGAATIAATTLATKPSPAFMRVSGQLPVTALPTGLYYHESGTLTSTGEAIQSVRPGPFFKRWSDKGNACEESPDAEGGKESGRTESRISSGVTRYHPLPP